MNPNLKTLSVGLLTAYVALFSNLFFTALSVPMALHFLGNEVFGLWVLAQQVSGYLVLLDLGLLAAFSRLLAEHKENVDQPEYGGLLRAAWLILGGLGIFIFFLGTAFAFFAGEMLNVPDDLQITCFQLLIILSVSAAFSLWSKAVGVPLWAFHRMEIINLNIIITHIAGLLTLFIGFFLGLGVYSLAFASFPGIVANAWIGLTTCLRNGYYPAAGKWGSPSLPLLKKGMLFGRDIFLISLGTQLVNASQVILLARYAGLQEGAVFSIVTKALLLCQQICSKVVQNSASKLTEYFVSGQMGKYFTRTLHLAAASSFLACAFGTGIIFFNRSLISFWTSGRITSGVSEDILLAFVLYLTVLMLVVLESFIAQANVMKIRFARIGEGCFIVLLSIFFHKNLNIFSLLGFTLLATAFSLCFCAFRLFPFMLHVQRGFFAIIFKSLFVLLIASFFAFLMDFFGQAMPSVFSLFFSVFLIIFSYRWIVPSPLRQELRSSAQSFGCHLYVSLKKLSPK